MTITEILPILKALNHKDKIRAIQFLANEIAKEEKVSFDYGEADHIWSLHNSFEASLALQKLLDEQANS